MDHLIQQPITACLNREPKSIVSSLGDESALLCSLQLSEADSVTHFWGKGAESGTQSHTPRFSSSYFVMYVCIYVYIFEAASLYEAQALLELPV